jgi:MSHA biogenesis protein MshI
LNWFRRQVVSSKRTAIVFAADRCTLATVAPLAGGRAAVEGCVVVPGDPAEQRAALAGWLERQPGGAGMVSCVLDPSEYQMLLVEAPDVLPAELKAAVRWRLKDLIDFPVADAVVDVFPIPEAARRTGAKMLYAVAARRHAVDQHVAVMRAAAAAVDVVDIPELALRNLAARLPEAQDGLILLWLTAHSAELHVIKGATIYLTRQVPFSARGHDETDPPPSDVEAIALELQRSMDYFESHYAQAPLAHLVIAPADARAQRLSAALADHTTLQMQLLDPRRAVDLPDGAGLPDRDGLIAIGAALRDAATAR